MSEPTVDMSLAELVRNAAEADRQGDLPRAAAFHAWAGAQQVEGGRHESGLEHFDRAMAAYEGSGQPEQALLMGYNRAHTLFLAERYHQSLEEYRQTEERARAAGFALHRFRSVLGRWQVQQALGDTAAAEATLEQVQGTAYEAEQLPTAAWADYELGRVAIWHHQYDRAIAAYESARATYTTLMIGEQVADCDLGLCAAYFHCGDRERALAALARARERYAMLGRNDRVATCDQNQATILGA
ncbi:MAG: hypothetical protein M3419_11325 [Actinomycetota bacterium]|nr:hypothetical protein [Actinomycetota bacterium]